MEHKTNEAFITNVDQDQGIITAIFSVMGNVDYGKDRIHNGAFKKTFAERGLKVLVLDQHRTDSINCTIAKPVRFRELERAELPYELLQKFPDATGGAEIQAQFSLEDDSSKRAFFRLKNDWVREWSFGYDAYDTSYTREEQSGKQASIREIRTIKLYEVSPVLFGMNDATMTIDAKSLGDKKKRIKKAFDFWQKGEYEFDRLEGHDLIATKGGKEFTVLYNDSDNKIEFEILTGGESAMDNEKGASGKTDLPLASREMAWDNSNAVASIRSVTDSTDAPSASYKNGFFWYDSENEDNFTAYKLPFAMGEDGKLVAVPRGIFAVAAVLQGSRGGVDIPESDMDAVKGKVERYYAKMRDEFDDDSIVVPWKKSKEGDKSDTQETEQKEPIQDESNQAADSKARLLNEIVAQNQIEDQLYDAWWKLDSALSESIYTIMRDDSIDDSVKLEMANQSLDQYHQAMLSWCEYALSVGLYQDEKKLAEFESKSGRAISAQNESRIRSAIDGLQSAMEYLNGLLPVEEEEEPESMELPDEMNTVVVEKPKTKYVIESDVELIDVDFEMIKTRFNEWLSGDFQPLILNRGLTLKVISESETITEVEIEHETESDEAGPIEETSPTETEDKESPFDFEKALLELKDFDQEFMEVQDNE